MTRVKQQNSLDRIRNAWITVHFVYVYLCHQFLNRKMENCVRFLLRLWTNWFVEIESFDYQFLNVVVIIALISKQNASGEYVQYVCSMFTPFILTNDEVSLNHRTTTTFDTHTVLSRKGDKTYLSRRLWSLGMHVEKKRNEEEISIHVADMTVLSN